MNTRSTHKYLPLLALTALLLQTPARAQLVTTFAGNLTPGNTDDQGTSASFNWPISLALDKNKNLYVADAENHRIRKITPSGMVSTFAGSIAGMNDDTGTAARFNHPLSVALNSVGYVFVADSKNNMIRKIAPDGTVTTVAGTGTAGSANGAGNTATFNYPNGLAIDAADNVYVADALNNMIRKITPAGIVSTLAGSTLSGNVNDQDTNARFNYPTGIAVDGTGNLFVADENNHIIRKITAGGLVTTFAGSSNPDNIDDTATAAAFFSPYGIAIDASNNLYVAEIGNNKIRKITPGRRVSSVAGNGVAGYDDGIRENATFNNPTGIAVDGTGILFVGDWKNNMIRKIDLTGAGIFTASPKEQLLLYPNPASDRLSIPTKEGSAITIYNLLGAKVYEGIATGHITTLSTKAYPAGLYSVTLILKDGTKQYARFTKQ